MNHFSNRLIKIFSCASLLISQSAFATYGHVPKPPPPPSCGPTTPPPKAPPVTTPPPKAPPVTTPPPKAPPVTTPPPVVDTPPVVTPPPKAPPVTTPPPKVPPVIDAPPVVDTPPTNTPPPATPAPSTPPPATPPTDVPAEPEPVVDAPPVEQTAEENRSLSARLEPLFYLDFDSGIGIVAVDSADAPRDGAPNKLQMTRQASVYQKSSYELLEGGLGAALGFYFKNATGTAANLWAQVGIMPMKGTEVSSVRYFHSLAAAKATPGYKSAPLDVTKIYKWQVGDSVTYKSKGGVIYVGGLGLGLAGLNAAKVAQGTWETHVEKIDTNRVYVKLTNSELDSLSVGTGAALAAASITDFSNADDGFSYSIDLESEVGRKVYQDLVRGNVTAAEQRASQAQLSPESAEVMKVEKFKRRSKGEGKSFFVGLPIILNATNSENKIQSHDVTDMLVENSKIDAQFGVYNFSTRTRAFGTHTTVSKGFQGAKYTTSDIKTSEVKENGEFGRFTWVYEDDNSSMRTLYRNMESLLQDTGLNQVKVAIPNVGGDLDFTNMTLNITMTSANTARLKNSSVVRSSGNMRDWSQRRAKSAFARKGGALCKTVSEKTTCETEFLNQTDYATQKMQAALSKMQARSVSRSAYTKAYAEFGQAAMTNQVTLAMALAMAGPGAEISFTLEGTYFKAHRMMMRTTNVEGRLEMMDPRDADQEASALDPKHKKSRIHGLVTNKNLTGLNTP